MDGSEMLIDGFEAYCSGTEAHVLNHDSILRTVIFWSGGLTTLCWIATSLHRVFYMSKEESSDALLNLGPACAQGDDCCDRSMAPTAASKDTRQAQGCFFRYGSIFSSADQQTSSKDSSVRSWFVLGVTCTGVDAALLLTLIIFVMLRANGEVEAPYLIEVLLTFWMTLSKVAVGVSIKAISGALAAASREVAGCWLILGAGCWLAAGVGSFALCGAYAAMMLNTPQSMMLSSSESMMRDSSCFLSHAVAVTLVVMMMFQGGAAAAFHQVHAAAVRKTGDSKVFSRRIGCWWDLYVNGNFAICMGLFAGIAGFAIPGMHPLRAGVIFGVMAAVAELFCCYSILEAERCLCYFYEQQKVAWMWQQTNSLADELERANGMLERLTTSVFDIRFDVVLRLESGDLEVFGKWPLLDDLFGLSMTGKTLGAVVHKEKLKVGVGLRVVGNASRHAADPAVRSSLGAEPALPPGVAMGRPVAENKPVVVEQSLAFEPSPVVDQPPRQPIMSLAKRTPGMLSSSGIDIDLVEESDEEAWQGDLAALQRPRAPPSTASAPAFLHGKAAEPCLEERNEAVCPGNDCLPPSALVMVENESVPRRLRDVKPGERVLCFDNVGDGMKYARVMDLKEKRGPAQWVVVHLSDGTSMRMTEDHPIQPITKGPRGNEAGTIVSAGKLKPGDHSLMVLKSMPITVSSVQCVPQQGPTGVDEEGSTASSACSRLSRRITVSLQHPERHTVFVASPKQKGQRFAGMRAMAVGSCNAKPGKAFAYQRFAKVANTFLNFDDDEDETTPTEAGSRQRGHSAPPGFRQRSCTSESGIALDDINIGPATFGFDFQAELPQPLTEASECSLRDKAMQLFPATPDASEVSARVLFSAAADAKQATMIFPDMPYASEDEGSSVPSSLWEGESVSDASSGLSQVAVLVGNARALVRDAAGNVVGLENTGDFQSARISEIYEIQEAGLPSVGSAGHAAGTCKLCVFENKRINAGGQACLKGIMCDRCHCEHELQKKNKGKTRGSDSWQHARWWRGRGAGSGGRRRGGGN
eukprot:TRINITY_DN22909_c0_g1_i2.p1 TRINITY_DN22909_c0_g1~~TRINITY_DN22909_c0_g1_i2.p1  ORF type:complete len:1039 (+),score=225.49 TRINITY_DN22909_c0_g1_i2:121-3237(+)